MKNINKKGFTLVELLAVIVILSMLLLLAVPAITRQVELARKKAFIEDANTIMVAVKDKILKTESDIPKNSTFPSYQINEINSLLDKKLGKSPFGGQYEIASVRVITDNNKRPTFSVCLIDSDGIGFGYTLMENLDIDLFDLTEHSKNCETKGRRTSTSILLRDFVNEGSENKKKSFPEINHNDFNNTNTQMTNPEKAEYRFVGSNAAVTNNYVYFNCSDTSHQNSSTCELYRIIGMGPVDNGTGTFEQRVKLVRNTPVQIEGSNKVNWNNENVNDWTNATLKTYLNTTFYNNINNRYKAMIAPAKYYLGGAQLSDTGFTPKTLYEYERKKNNDVSYNYFHPNHDTTTSWTGLVGLMYGSDFGYAASSKAECLTTPLMSFNTNNCIDNNWLWKINRNAQSTPSWTMTQISSKNDVFLTGNTGLKDSASIANTTLEAYPVVYLNANAEFVGGDGSESNPYRLFNS